MDNTIIIGTRRMHIVLQREDLDNDNSDGHCKLGWGNQCAAEGYHTWTSIFFRYYSGWINDEVMKL